MDTHELQRALGLHRQGQLQQAEAIYRQLAATDARHFGVAHMLGLALLQQGKAVAAAQQLQRALVLDPESAEALGHLGDALKAAGQLQAALRLRPDGPRILFSCANALVELGRFDEAMARFDKCIVVQPDFDGARRNRGILKLLLGDLAAGWPDYERRRPKPADREIAPVAPDWLGEDLAGRSLLVSDATGLGDAIQFIRYLPMVAVRGARVSFLGNRRLFRLFKPLASSIEFLSALPADRFRWRSSP